MECFYILFQVLRPSNPFPPSRGIDLVTRQVTRVSSRYAATPSCVVTLLQKEFNFLSCLDYLSRVVVKQTSKSGKPWRNATEHLPSCAFEPNAACAWLLKQLTQTPVRFHTSKSMTYLLRPPKGIDQKVLYTDHRPSGTKSTESSLKAGQNDLRAHLGRPNP